MHKSFGKRPNVDGHREKGRVDRRKEKKNYASSKKTPHHEQHDVAHLVNH